MTFEPHILLVEDDREIRTLVARYLSESAFRVSLARDGREMDKILADSKIDLVLLDLMLPGENGLALCRRLRETGNMPIMIVSAKGDEIDRIVGLEMGADDYLPKPFNPRELLARIQAVLRRQAPLPIPGAPTTTANVVEFGGYSLDLAARRLSKGGADIALTTGEFALLKILVSHPREPLSREKLMELARGREHEPFDRSIDIQVSRVRKLIEPDPAHPRYIQTVWGFGYVFVPDGEAA